MSAQENLFDSRFTFESTYGLTGKVQVNNGLWAVDDRSTENPTLRFQRDRNSFVEMIYDGGYGSILENVPLPIGLVKFIEEKFLPLTGATKHSKYVSIDEAVTAVFKFLDWQEPYFFLVDMPVSLTQDNFSFSYRNKATGSVLDPTNLETFQVMKGWKFPHYTYAFNLLNDERTQAIRQGRQIPKPPNYKKPSYTCSDSPYFDMEDIVALVSETIFGGYSYLSGCIEEWTSRYYEDLKYDCRESSSPRDIESIEVAETDDKWFWTCIALGVFTWLKGPHGLKFLINYHPIYYQVLDWDEERNHPIISEGSGGFAIVDGLTIYTGRDLEKLESIKPGTCCVSKQTLHCTQRVNVKAFMRNCDCGKPRDYMLEDYYDDRREHPSKVYNNFTGEYELSKCFKWEKENPAQMVFVSYAAMYNMIHKNPGDTQCVRAECPNTKCSYHQGSYARLRSLTDRRTKMLTGPSQS